MLHRHLTGHLLDALLDTPAALVNGARQTGKSTLVQSEGSNDVRGLQTLASAVGKNWVRGVVLYAGADIIPFSANLYGVPISRLWSA
jgi:hypothetical protein